LAVLQPAPAPAQADTLPPRLADRGPGIPASLFGTYLGPRELVIYPFAEYTLDDDREYQPEEFGVGPDVDFRGRFRGTSSQLFVGYGVSDRIALEVEAAHVTARTVTVRIAAEWNHAEHKPDLGEFAVEYLKRVAPAGRLCLALEGGEGGALDEWDLITGVRWRVVRSVDLKLDNALGLSSKVTDWAPQGGVMIHLER
jgi:hypothetical protein